MSRTFFNDRTRTSDATHLARASRTRTRAPERAWAAALSLATLAACAQAGGDPSPGDTPASNRGESSIQTLDGDERNERSGRAEDTPGEPTKEDTQTTQLVAAAIPAAELRAVIRNVSLRGEQCGSKGGQGVMPSPQGFVTVKFDDAVVDALGAPVVATCEIAIELEVPEGMQLSAPRVWWSGVAAEGAEAVQRFAWEGEEALPPVRSELSSVINLESAPAIWSPTCSERRATFIASLEVHLPAEEGSALDTFSFATEWAKGVAWRTCDGADAAAPNAELGELCAGPQGIACADGLVCEHDSFGPSAGHCVDPSAQLAPAELGGRCGGVTQRACIAGLTCWWPSKYEAENDGLGTCTRPALGVGGECQTGVPSLSCEEGLHCKLKTHFCVEVDGGLRSECGDGLPPCDEGLVCDTGVDSENGVAAGHCKEIEFGCAASGGCDDATDEPIEQDQTQQTEPYEQTEPSEMEQDEPTEQDDRVFFDERR